MRSKLLPEKLLRGIANAVICGILLVVPRKEERPSVLIVKIDALGDFVIFLPSLIRYRKLFPGHKLTLLVASPVTRIIAERLAPAYIDEVLFVDDKRFARDMLYRLSFSIKLYKKNFEIALYPVYFRRFIGDFLMLVTKAKQKLAFAGYRIQEEQDFTMSKHYTKLVYVPQDVTSEFYKHPFLLQQLFNDTPEHYAPYFPLSEKDTDEARELLNKHGVPSSYVVIFPGSGSPIRNWPTQKFATIVNHIHSLGFHVVLCGSAAETPITEAIIAQIADRDSITNLTGSTSVFQLAALIQQSELYIGGDTGPTHISAAVGTPTLCLMGGGVFREFFPYGDEAKNRIVYDKTMACRNDDWECTKNIAPGSPAPCIAHIRVDDVIKEIDYLLKIKK